ncbi:NAD(P)-binding protein [Mycena olivaceomarginata]|nr:NAD(P)-binding protein [Mycena olivaceomarginata]
MTITQAQSAPLVAVVGATGVQGGSVIKALSESEKPYRIRGFTRDLTKTTAEALKKQGVEMIAVNLIPENKEEVYKAFAGADYTFLVTNYWEQISKEKEISQGKLLVDASKAAGVKGIIWSGLVSANKISGGKYTKVEAFDGKALVTEYGRASGIPFADVQAGFYATNLLGSLPLFAKQTGRRHIYVRMTTACVRRVLEMPVFPDGTEFYTTSEDITVEEIARQISQDRHSILTKLVPRCIEAEQSAQRFVSLGFPPGAGADTVEFFNEFGYYGGKPSSSKQGLARPTRTFAEFVKAADWSKILG